MAFEKKPSSNTDRGKVRSAEELETYGVWVKSGPQDMSADFGDDAVPFDHPGFDMGFGGMGAPGAGREAPDIAFDSFDDGSFVADGFADGNFAPGPFENDNFAQGNFPPGGVGSSHQDEVSAQLLLRIADELSSIRADLDTLKKDFAEIRSEGGPDEIEPIEEIEAWGGTGFFTGEDDGKIALTDNEMDDILASSGFNDVRNDFTPDEDNEFASLRDADEAALKELSRQNEATGVGSLIDEDETEGSGIDFGMDLDDSSPFGDIDEGDEADIQDRLTELETDNIFDTDLDFLNEGVPRASNLDIIEETDIFEAFSDDLPSPDTLDDMDELRDLRMHGVNPLTPPPEDSSYLEEDPFIASDSGDEEVFDGEDAESVFDAGIGEDGFDFDAFAEKAQPNDGVVLLSEVSYEVSYTEELSPVGDMLSLDDEGESFDDELALGNELSLDDLSSLDGMSSMGMGMEDDELGIGDEVFLGDPLSRDEELLLLDDSSSEDDELSLDDDLSPIDGLFLDDDGLSLGDDELSLGEGISMGDDDELTFDGEISMDEEISLDGEPSSDGEIILPSWLLSPETTEADDSPVMEDVPSLNDEFTTDEEISTEDETLFGGEIPDDEVSSEFSMEDMEGAMEAADGLPEFPQDLPDSSPDELMLDDESTLDEPILDDDISLDLDGFDDGFEIDDLDSEDSNIIRVIPEGFKTGAEETLISFDDDLEAIAEEDEEEEAPSPPPKDKPEGKPKTRAEKMDAVDANPDISPNLKKDLKNVLSYMDQLLESLPEDKIEEFAKSEHFDTYRKLFKELGLVQ